MGAIIAIILSFIGLTLGGVWLAGVLCGAVGYCSLAIFLGARPCASSLRPGVSRTFD